MEAPVLGNGQLLLRAFEEGDAAWVLEACQDEATQRWTLVPSPYTAADAASYVGELAPSSWREQGFGPLAVVDARGGSGLASVGVVAAEGRVAELGYWVAPWARRRGVGSTALRLLTTWVQAELGRPRCELHIEAANAASVATALRAGYHHEDPSLAQLPRRVPGEGLLLVDEASPGA